MKDTDAVLSKCRAGIAKLNSSAEADLRPLPELDPGEVLAWATSALEVSHHQTFEHDHEACCAVTAGRGRDSRFKRQG